MVYKDGDFVITPINTILTTVNQQLYKYFKHNIDEIKKELLAITPHNYTGIHTF